MGADDPEVQFQEQTQRRRSDWKFNVFDRRQKARLTVFCIILMTIAYYIVLYFGLTLEHFTSYSGFLTLFLAGFTGADILNTRAFLKQKGEAQQ